MTLFLAIPVQATTYTVTITLSKDDKTVWTCILELEVPDSTVELTVPQPLYDLIVSLTGTDTFPMPFEVTIGPLALHVESDPPSLTIVFKPMSPGDVNGDKIVNIIDILKVAVHFGETPETPNYDLFSDVNFDYRINIVDVLTIAVNFGDTY